MLAPVRSHRSSLRLADATLPERCHANRCTGVPWRPILSYPRDNVCQGRSDARAREMTGTRYVIVHASPVPVISRALASELHRQTLFWGDDKIERHSNPGG